MYLKAFSFFLFFIFRLDLKAEGIVSIIRENPSLSTFYSYINNTELEATLQQKFPWNWTIFAPNNKAFDALPKKVYDKILSDTSLRKMLIMDHILIGEKSSADLNSKITEEITVTSKPIQLYKRKSLYVKDMVVVNENTSANNGVNLKLPKSKCYYPFWTQLEWEACFYCMQVFSRADANLKE